LIYSLAATLCGSALSAQTAAVHFEVADSAGVAVGKLVETHSFNFPREPVVTLTAGGHAIAAAVNREGQMRTPVVDENFNIIAVYFLTPDCTGQAYLSFWLPLPSIWEPQAIVGTSNLVYVGTSETRQAINFQSVLRHSAPCSVESGFSDSAVPASLIQQLPPFQPPFHVRACTLDAGLPVPAVSPVGLVLLAVILSALGITLVRRRTFAGTPATDR